MTLALSGVITARRISLGDNLGSVQLTTTTGQDVIVCGLHAAQVNSLATLGTDPVNLLIEPVCPPPAVASSPMQQAQDIERDRIVAWLRQLCNADELPKAPVTTTATDHPCGGSPVASRLVRLWLLAAANDIRDGVHRR